MSLEGLFPGTSALDKLPDDMDFGDTVAEENEDEPTSVPAGGDDSADADADAEPGDAGADADDLEAEGDAEPESEDEAPADEEAADEAPVAEDKKGKGPRIPKERLDQALRKQRAAEQRAQELENQLASLRAERAQADAPKPLSGDEIKAKMAEANEALIAGDTAKAAELQAELFTALAARPEPAAQAPVERDLVAEVETRMEFKAALTDLNARFPELDENGEQFDEDLSQEAVDLQRGYLNRGYSLTEATVKAAEAVAKLYDLEDRKAGKAPAPAEKQVKAAQLEQAAKRKEKIEKATKAPPTLPMGKGDTGEDVAFDIRNATPEEFMALPQSVQDRLLGNSV